MRVDLCTGKLVTFYGLAFWNMARTAFRNNTAGKQRRCDTPDPASEESASHEYSGHYPQAVSLLSHQGIIYGSNLVTS